MFLRDISATYTHINAGIITDVNQARVRLEWIYCLCKRCSSTLPCSLGGKKQSLKKKKKTQNQNQLILPHPQNKKNHNPCASLGSEVVILFPADQLPVGTASNAGIPIESLYNFPQQLLGKAKHPVNYYAIQHMKLLLSMLPILSSFNSVDCIFHQMCFFLCKIPCA